MLTNRDTQDLVSPYEVLVTSSDVRAFAEAIGLPGRAYLAPNAPCPPTFFTRAPYLWVRAYARAQGQSPLGLLHADPAQLLLAEEEHIFHTTPPRVGDQLVARSRLEEATTKAGRRGGTLTFYRLCTDLKHGAEAARPSVTVLSTMVATERVPVGGRTTETSSDEHWNTGIPSWTVGPITRAQIAEYQAVSGDANALHNDEDFARAAGYPSVISMAMLHAGWLSAGLVRHFGPESIRRFRARARAVAFPGDTLSCRGRIDGALRNRDGELVRVRLQALRRGEVVTDVEALCAARRQTRSNP